MTQFFIFVIISAISPFISQPETSFRTEYYSSIAFRESPFPRQKGIVPLTDEVALSRKHYRFEIDTKNRIVSISFWHQNKRTDPNHTANLFFETSYQKIEYIDGKEQITYHDRFDNQVSIGSVYKAIYALDSMGRRNKLQFFDQNGMPAENQWNIAEYQWSIQPDGSVIENRYDLSGQAQPLRTRFPFHRIRLCYNVDGYVSLMQNIDQNNLLLNNETGVAQDVILFDAAGRWLGWQVLDAEGNLKCGNGPNVAGGDNIPDEYGYETSQTHYDENGRPIRSAYGFYVGKRKYDQYGNYDITWFEDALGNKAINTSTRYAVADYEWDETGDKLVSISFFDNKNMPILRKGGYHKMKFRYGDDGVLMSREYLDLQEELVNRSDNGVAKIIYEYDQNFMQTKVTRLTREGNKL